MKPDQKTADAVKEVAVFMIARGKKFFNGWKAPVIFKYVAWHFLCGNLFVVRDHGAIAAAGIAWPTTVNDIYWRDHERLAQFDFTVPQSGEALLVAEVVGSPSACLKLWQLAMNRWPHIRRIFTYRRDKLVELHLATIERFLSYGK